MEFPFISRKGHTVIRLLDKVIKYSSRTVKLYEVACKGCGELYEWKLVQAQSNEYCRSCSAKAVGKRFKSKYPHYIRWTLNSMKQRCNNSNSKKYDRYGGRGITVCDEWNNDIDGVDNFYADMGERPDNTYSIDRIDNNGNYEPTNCKWSTKSEQQLNRNYKHGHTGTVVPPYGRCKGYQAEITLGSKRRLLGTFSTEEDARKCIHNVIECFNDYAFTAPLNHDIINKNIKDK